jgi:putative GTP pyrophosphokinase
MNPDDFGRWLHDQTPALKAWGGFVVSRVCDRLRHDLGDERFETFFKVTPTFRAKSVKSAVAKLIKKQSKYDDPKRQMTDLVGARFIVLVRTDLEVVERALASCSEWTLSRERDFEYEISVEPMVFDYQSIHYLARCKEDRVIDGVTVPADMSCEVQVRTLLQHAYAELVHDNIYKPEGEVPPVAKRLVARCMALMETTDEMFCSALHELKQVNTDRDGWLEFLPELYRQATGVDEINFDRYETSVVLDTYRDWLARASKEQVREFILQPVVAKRIKARATSTNLFGKPVCIILYWLLDTHKAAVYDRWPLKSMDDDVRLVMSDLGVAAKPV